MKDPCNTRTLRPGHLGHRQATHPASLYEAPQHESLIGRLRRVRPDVYGLPLAHQWAGDRAEGQQALLPYALAELPSIRS
eukprot:7311633-Alexandrium_andersonii.AAC.1